MSRQTLYRSLIKDLIAEAEAKTGTWKLATYLKMRAMIHQFTQCDCTLLVDRIVDLITRDDTELATTYKLSQMCSAIHKLSIPAFEHLFSEHRAAFEDVCKKIHSTRSLGGPTVQLLRSLAVPANRSRRARRQSVTPAVTNREFRVPRIICSRTPDVKRS
jgi:hypothetical protein